MSQKTQVVLSMLTAVAAGILFFSIGCGSLRPVIKKQIKKPKTVPAIKWQESLPSGSFRSQTPVRITLLHSAENPKDVDDIEGHIKKEHDRAVRQGQGHLSAHYYIDPFGIIFEGRQIFLQGRLPKGMEAMDTSGHILIMALGDYEHKEPSEEFKKSLSALLFWLCDHHEIPFENLHGLDYYMRTDNPGKYLSQWLNSPSLYYDYLAAKGLEVPTPTPEPKPEPTPEEN